MKRSRYTEIDRLVAAGYVVRFSYVPSRRRLRARAAGETLRDGWGRTAAEAAERLYATMVGEGLVRHEVPLS